MKKLRRIEVTVDERLLFGEPLRHWAPFSVSAEIRRRGWNTVTRAAVQAPYGAPKRLGVLAPRKVPCVIVYVVCPQGCEHEVFSVEWADISPTTFERLDRAWRGLGSDAIAKINSLVHSDLAPFFERFPEVQAPGE